MMYAKVTLPLTHCFYLVLYGFQACVPIHFLFEIYPVVGREILLALVQFLQHIRLSMRPAVGDGTDAYAHMNYGPCPRVVAMVVAMVTAIIAQI